MLTVTNHPNRSQQNRTLRMNPTPAEVRAARESVGLTQQQAAELIYTTWRTWQNWESTDPAEQRRMPAAAFEYFLVLTGQMPLSQALEARAEILRR